MLEKKELTQEELNHVTGGDTTIDNLKDKIVRGKKISIYDTEKKEILNKEILVEIRHDGPQYYYAGTLLKSWERYNKTGRSFRTITMRVKYGSNGKNNGKTITISLIATGYQSSFVWLIDHYI